VARELGRQENIEIVAAIVSVARGHAGERAAPAVEYEHDGFTDHERGGDEDEPEFAGPGQHGNRENAAGEDRSGQRVDELHDAQRGGGRHGSLKHRAERAS
jgi:hypothetical protein